MIKIFECNQEYLEFLAQRDKAKAELKKLKNEYGNLQIIEEKITKISKSYKNAKRRFRKASADKAICEAEGKKVDKSMLSRCDRAKEEFLRAKRDYENFKCLKSQKMQVEKAKQKYEEAEKAILNFLYEHRKTDLLPERIRLEKEIETLVAEFEKKYGHVWKMKKIGGSVCELCGAKEHYARSRNRRAYSLESRYHPKFINVGENGIEIKMVTEDTWPKEVAEMYAHIDNRKKELKKYIDILMKTCGRFNHEYDSGEDYGVCTICGHKEPYVHRYIDLFYD